VAVLTSGGDAAGMNSAIRGVVRTALAKGLEPFGVEEGLQGLVDGGDRIRALSSADAGGILQQGGTFLGTARSADFRTRDGLRRAARNMIERGIDGLVVIGGDGSLSGADELRAQWAGLLDELVAAGSVDPAAAERHRHLCLVGIAGSIDNDMFGTDMTIGADTALHRITEAVDAIQSTASSHQRTFVIEVMGRHCGYLALMGSLATGANFVLIPENPPKEGWEEVMCEVLHGGRDIGRRASIVLVAEGAHDTHGTPITAEGVRTLLEERLGEDARVTILGHLQRGGSPSAFDRFLGTLLGHAAVEALASGPAEDPVLVGIEGLRVVRRPLMDCVARTRSVAEMIDSGDYAHAMQTRGRSFTGTYDLLRNLVRARPRRAEPGRRALRLGVLHAGGPAPGMNTAVRVAVRVGMNEGHRLVAVRNGFRGLARNQVDELEWMSVSGWMSRPGAELGTTRVDPGPADLDAMAESLRANHIDGLLMIGGFSGYRAAHRLAEHLRARRLGGQDTATVPIVCVPASIDNDLPVSDLSIGADTALNCIARDVDRIKESAVASHRVFVVEVMGHDCGYLAMMSGIATGAEYVYLPEEGITLDALSDDLDELRTRFAHGNRRGLAIRSEHADQRYTTDFLASLFDHESQGLYDVRTAILGHVQQGGDPSPFDRINASRMASAGMRHLVEQAEAGAGDGLMIGLVNGEMLATPLREFPSLVHDDRQRPLDPGWWMGLKGLAATMARPHPREG
jgi:6-phosphofructokinase 1